jgi:hypothetical protein
MDLLGARSTRETGLSCPGFLHQDPPSEPGLMIIGAVTSLTA